MPNLEARAEEIRKADWVAEGEGEGGQFLTCPLCGALVVEPMAKFHSRWHADLENMLYR